MRSLRGFVCGLIACAAVSLAGAQSYSPKPGESVLRLEIEGRGNVFILLHTKQAPRTTAHISRLAQQGFYNGQRFHEVIRSPRPYLVRLGDPLSKDASKLDDAAMGSGGSGARIPYENSGLSHEAGAVGLATLRDDKNAGDSQFYIMLAPAKFLDGNYTVFGKVVAGMEVVGRVQKGDVVVSVRVVSG